MPPRKHAPSGRCEQCGLSLDLNDRVTTLESEMNSVQATCERMEKATENSFRELKDDRAKEVKMIHFWILAFLALGQLAATLIVVFIK